MSTRIAPPHDVPDWVNEAPSGYVSNPTTWHHTLAMYDSSAENIELIKLTRSEYEALKRYLAAQRGYISARD
ncbi:MAG: hypothetical protein ACR2JB_23495 [Bryobacteraceae bacterium]